MKKLPLFLCAVVILYTHTTLANDLFVDAAAPVEAKADGSAEHPFPNIEYALKAASPGTRLRLAPGRYVEALELSNQHDLTLESIEVGTVLITSAEPVTTWTRDESGVSKTLLDRPPLQVWRRDNLLACSRYPTESWRTAQQVQAESGGATWSLAAPAEWADHPPELDGARLYIWTQNGNQFFTCPITPESGAPDRLYAEVTRANMKPADGDLFAVENAVALLPQTGGWATIKESDGRWALYVAGPTDQMRVVTSTRPAIQGKNVSGLRLYGLTIQGFGAEGLRMDTAQDVVIDNCRVLDCDGIGLVLNHVTGGRITDSIFSRNAHGVSISKGSSGLSIERNDIGYNGTDGLLITFGSSDITVRHNTLHHHQLWGHPDNAQMYKGVNNIRFIENIFLSGGQALMTQESQDILFQGNLLVGSAANQLILGHGSSHRFTIVNNTFAFAGYSGLNISGTGHLIRSNLFVNGHGHALYSSDQAQGFDSDYNLFWNTAQPGTAPLLGLKGHWPRTLATVQQLGLEQHSEFAAPEFVHAPEHLNVLSRARLTECTRDTVYLREPNHFHVGETIECNFDGQARRIIATEEDRIQFAPGLNERPLKCWIIAGWGAKTNLVLDLTSGTASRQGAPANVIERLRAR